MPVFKVTFTFGFAQRANGWSESWYVQQNDLDSAIAAGTLIARPRAAELLDASYTLNYMRVSENVPKVPKPPRRSRMATLERLSFTGGIQSGASGQVDPELPWTCALIRVSNANKSIFRMWSMRGVPDNWWSGGSDKLAIAAVNRGLKTFVKAVVGSGGVILNQAATFGDTRPILIVGMQYERMSKRSTGRPLFLDRGRR